MNARILSGATNIEVTDEFNRRSPHGDATVLAHVASMRTLSVAVVLALLSSGACHPGPVIDTGPKPPAVGGTIAGIVSAGNAPVTGRKVTAIDTTSGTRFEATTGANGGYTIKVPQGTYRLEIELKAGERLVKQPDVTKIDKSDLDPKRDFVIGGGIGPR